MLWMVDYDCVSRFASHAHNMLTPHYHFHDNYRDHRSLKMIIIVIIKVMLIIVFMTTIIIVIMFTENYHNRLFYPQHHYFIDYQIIKYKMSVPIVYILMFHVCVNCFQFPLLPGTNHPCNICHLTNS